MQCNTLAVLGKNYINFEHENTQLYIVIAESRLPEKEKHFQLFFQGVDYYHDNRFAEIDFNPSNCEKIYGFYEPPFYQGFNYAKLQKEYFNDVKLKYAILKMWLGIYNNLSLQES